MNINIDVNDIRFGQGSDVEKFLPAGIHENLVMYDVKYAVSTPGGNKFLCFYFKDEENRKSSHTEYEPKPSENLPNGYEGTLEDLFKQKVTNLVSRVGQVLVSGGYITREQLQIPSPWDFEAFAKHVVALLVASGYQNKKIRAKFIYNNKGYTSLPQYNKYQFIEEMTVVKEESKIQKLKIDKFDRPEADKEVVKDNPFVSSAPSLSNDSPF